MSAAGLVTPPSVGASAKDKLPALASATSLRDKSPNRSHSYEHDSPATEINHKTAGWAAGDVHNSRVLGNGLPSEDSSPDVVVKAAGAQLHQRPSTRAMSKAMASLHDSRSELLHSYS